MHSVTEGHFNPAENLLCKKKKTDASLFTFVYNFSSIVFKLWKSFNVSNKKYSKNYEQ